MLQLSAKLYNQPLLSLRTGSPIGRTTEPIIDPRNLKIIGFYCQVNSHKNEKILLAEDIREVFHRGIIVNDEEVLTDPDDLIRLSDMLSEQFDLINKQVITVSGVKLGKISDYSFDQLSLFIMQLNVRQSIFKSLTGGELIISRNQINEVTAQKIVVNDDTEKIGEPELASV